MISDLPRDLAEEVLSRLPVTSLRGVRFTCKKWNSLTKKRSFTKKHNREAAAAKNKQRTEFQVVMLLEDKWIQPRNSYNRFDRYALGYERKNSYSLRGYKVLRFMDDYDSRVKQRITEFEIYSLDSDSWKVVHVNPDWDIEYFSVACLSRETPTGMLKRSFLIGGSFFVDEKKKVAVVLDIDRGKSCPTRNTAYMIGENDYFKKVDLGGSVDLGRCWPLVCSYVPSSVQIKQASPPSNKKNTP
ncbi:unnamed protein product [Microthlaspi erraticum]|uniref:F-box domain-containing protein n=1 Tax=Microthlaspi erraticum TaxID=1685480 RepID=A0A6D2HLW1_9BRAS|nr:unnamed protein product [Microthlaspi erraticum]